MTAITLADRLREGADQIHSIGPARAAGLMREAANALTKLTGEGTLVDELAQTRAVEAQLRERVRGGLTAGPSVSNREGKTLRAVHAAVPSPPWRESAADMGLEVIEHAGGSHVQLKQDGKTLAEWWPGKGTTMMDGRRGPRCVTGEDVIAWLKNV